MEHTTRSLGRDVTLAQTHVLVTGSGGRRHENVRLYLDDVQVLKMTPRAARDLADALNRHADEAAEEHRAALAAARERGES